MLQVKGITFCNMAVPAVAYGIKGRPFFYFQNLTAPKPVAYSLQLD
jgi:hypothetical protein